VTAAAGVKTLDNSPNLLTISDLSRVWIVCDVYEDDLPTVHVGDRAEIHAEAYPEHPLEGRVDNIAPVLDPALRTAKVRIDVANPGMLRLGMFVTATVQGHAVERQAVVPATAVLHLHDRDWVYVPAGHGYFRRVEVVGGTMLPGGAQELRSGLLPGQRVVADALVFQSTVDQ
jgi:cobalt-zinc-cadmium efflux system membrane fusion protein